jgi:hypothetical protein
VEGLGEVRMGIAVLVLIDLWTYPYSFGTVRTKGILTVICLSCGFMICIPGFLVEDVELKLIL